MEVKLFMTALSKEEQWHNHIEACTGSGMSIKSWCKANNLSPHQYHYWKSKFNETNSNAINESPQWAPLIADAPQVVQPQNTPIVLQIGDFNLELTQGFDKQALVELINLLGSLC